MRKNKKDWKYWAILHKPLSHKKVYKHFAICIEDGILVEDLEIMKIKGKFRIFWKLTEEKVYSLGYKKTKAWIRRLERDTERVRKWRKKYGLDKI